jgi:hypothetical protein
MKNASWIRHARLLHDVYECSNCGAEYKETYPTCPKCKAKMTGTKRDMVDDIILFDSLFED